MSSSSYMEGRCCPLAKRGYSRDGRTRWSNSESCSVPLSSNALIAGARSAVIQSVY